MSINAYEQWEAVNEVLSRYAFHPREAEELAKVIVALEQLVAELEAKVEAFEHNWVVQHIRDGYRDDLCDADEEYR